MTDTYRFSLNYRGLPEDKLRELMDAVAPFAEYNRQYDISKERSINNPRSFVSIDTNVEGQPPKKVVPEEDAVPIEIEPSVNDPKLDLTNRTFML